MTDIEVELNLPVALQAGHRRLLDAVAARNLSDHGDDLLGLVLSGSAGRGLASARSDVDVYVVLTDAAVGHRVATRSPQVDEIPVTLSDLLEPPRFDSPGWWSRWAFAWAPVVLDRTDGALPGAVRRMATVSRDEAGQILTKHDRLDGWLNFAYRALKNDHDGRHVEARLDSCESVPWLLDVVFSLAGRVRPYNKYLPWELDSHPLPGWDGPDLLRLVSATLDGDPSALRATFARIESLCFEFDSQGSEPILSEIIEGWGDGLDPFRT